MLIEFIKDLNYSDVIILRLFLQYGFKSDNS